MQNTLNRLYHTSKICRKDLLRCHIHKIEKVCLVDSDMIDPCKPSPKVVIIGAGMAGLSAAERLYKAGLHDLTLLEATERPGGRIQSCWLGNSVVDTGAQWIHGCSINNSAMTLAAQEGLLDPTNLYRHVEGTDSAVMYLASDSKIINKYIAVRAYLAYKQIEKKAYDLYKNKANDNLYKDKEHGSLMNYLSKEIEKSLEQFPANQREHACQVMYAQTNSLKNRWGADLEKISADLLGSFKTMLGDTLALHQGFIGILTPIINAIPKDRILYNKVVNNIQYAKICNEDGTPAARAKVSCCDGSSYCADYVIITFSLGVLKALAHKIFQPKLPAQKLEAIKKLGYGNSCKIFMEYSRPFWAWREATMNLVWNNKEMNQKNQWMTGVSTIEEVPGSRQVLMIAVAGEQAAMVETRPEKIVAEEVTTILRKFTGDVSLPNPNSILISKWKNNPHFAGTNSYMAMDSSVCQQHILAECVPKPCEKINPEKPPPKAPILFFAGEATCPEFYSTVHGARLSGLKAAQDVLDYTKLYQGPPPMPGQLPNPEPC